MMGNRTFEDWLNELIIMIAQGAKKEHLRNFLDSFEEWVRDKAYNDGYDSGWLEGRDSNTIWNY